MKTTTTKKQIQKSSSKENLKNENDSSPINSQPSNNTNHNQSETNNHKPQTNGHNESSKPAETNGLSKSPSPIVHHINIEKESPPNDTNQIKQQQQQQQTQQQPAKSMYEIPHGATTKDLPPGVFYKVIR